jgi:hypothetical protein
MFRAYFGIFVALSNLMPTLFFPKKCNWVENTLTIPKYLGLQYFQTRLTILKFEPITKHDQFLDKIHVIMF